MTAIEILVATRELLTDPSHWTKGESARDVRGKEVPPNYPSAVCWCMTGALNKVVRSPCVWFKSEAVLSAADLIHGVVGGPIPSFNDAPTTTHATVLRVLDAAIEKAKHDG